MTLGLRDYRSFDYGGSNDPRNLGNGRNSVVGTLIHTTSGVDSLSWLIGGSAETGKPASADYLITRSGDRYSLCPEGYFPYHAGKSRLIYNNQLYQGDEISSLLLGVEIENTDNDNCTFEQVDSLAELIVERGLHYGWRWPYYILGHYEVARPLGRRSDPQGFPWGDFLGRLYARAYQLSIDGF